MKSQNDHHQVQVFNKTLSLEYKPYYYLLAGIGLIVLLGFLIFRPVATELTCVRWSPGLIECNLVQNTLLFQKHPVKIINPVAVDVLEFKRKGQDFAYGAEIRAADNSHTRLIWSTYNYQFVQDSANEVNAFLHSSQATLFSKKFPAKKATYTNSKMSLMILGNPVPPLSTNPETKLPWGVNQRSKVRRVSCQT